MVSTKLSLSLNEPVVRTVYAKEGDSGRTFNLDIDPTPQEDGTLRIKRPDGVEVTSSASSGGEEVGTSFTTIADGEFTALETEINPIQDLHGQSNPYPAGGGKNLLPMTVEGIKSANTGTWSGNSITIANVTYTILTDDSGNVIGIGTSGTANANSVFYLYSSETTFLTEGTTYALNGCPADGGSNKYKLDIVDRRSGTTGDTNEAADYGAGTSLAVTSTIASSSKLRFRIVIYSGIAAPSSNFYPMLRLSSVEDATFAPYSNICPIYPSNGKNLFPPHAEGTSTFWNMNIKWNADGTITVDGTTTATAFQGTTVNTVLLPSGKYIFNGQNDADVGNYKLTLQLFNNDTTPSTQIVNRDTGADYTFTLETPTTVGIRVGVRAGCKIDVPVTMMPMIRAVGDATYQPYGGIAIKHLGKNLLPYASTFTYRDVAFTVNEDGTISASGTASGGDASSNIVLRAGAIPTGNYYFNGCPSGGSGTTYNCYVMDATTGSRAKQWDGTTNVVNSVGDNICQLYIDSTHQYSFYFRVMNGKSAPTEPFKPMIWKADTDSGVYEPYNLDLKTLSLGRDVYGGTVDLATGKLTVTKVCVDLGDLTWSYNSTNTVFTAPADGGLTNVGLNVMPDIICSQYPIITTRYGSNFPSAPDKSCTWSRDNSNVLVKDTDYTDKNTFTTAMSGVQVVYPLATPLEYDLTPQQISTLLGENNIFSDSGDVVDVAFTYDGMYAELPSSATSVVGRCIGDVELNGVSTMPFTLVVQKNNQGVTP